MKFNFKLYLRKLVLMLLYIGAYFLICFIGSMVLETVSNFFKEYPFVKYAIVLGIPFIIVLILIYRARSKHNELRKSYMAYYNYKKPTLKMELKFLIEFPEFQYEIAAFATLALIFAIFACFIPNATVSPFIRVLGGIFIFICLMITYFLIDFVLWCAVHRKWVKDYGFLVTNK